MEIWFSSDLHLAHGNILKFMIPCPTCGGRDLPSVDFDNPSPLCPECFGAKEVRMRDFPSLKEMHECIVEQHNARVKPSDHWWCLGDLTMTRQLGQVSDLIEALNGKKRLLLGNHDEAKMSEYARYFEKIRVNRVIDNVLFTHYPVHPNSLGKFDGNAHGHIHRNDGGGYPPRVSTRRDGSTKIQPYVNLSIEVLDYAPVNLGTVKQMIRRQQEALGA